MSRKLIVSSLTMTVVALGVWSFFVQRPVYHAKPGYVRLVCPGTTDAQIPFREGMTLRDALAASPAIAQFGVDQVDTIWLITKPTHSAWSDVSEAVRETLVQRAPSLWQQVSTLAPNLLGPSATPSLSLNDRLFAGEAVHLQSRW